MENIDIIIVAGVSFLLVVGGLFIGMYFARRNEAERAAKLEEREERVLRMRAKLERDRFSVSAEGSADDVLLDEDLFKGFKEELEQERMEIEMRREELELDMRMLEEENNRLKSRLTGRGSLAPSDAPDADDALIVDEAAEVPLADIEDAVFEEADDEEVENDVESTKGNTAERRETVRGEPDLTEPPVTDADAPTDSSTSETPEEEKARNTIFGDFFFDDAATPDFVDLPDEEDAWSSEASPDAHLEASPEGAAIDEDIPDLPEIPEDKDEHEDDAPLLQMEESTESDGMDPAESTKESDQEDDGWSSEADRPEPTGVDVRLPESVGGDGAALSTAPDAASTSADTEDPSRPGPPAFDHMLTTDGDFPADGSIEQVLGLSRSDLALMNDLGYGTFRSIADLSEDEITRLAEAFDIPEQTIREEWIPDSRLRAAREPRA